MQSYIPGFQYIHVHYFCHRKFLFKKKSMILNSNIILNEKKNPREIRDIKHLLRNMANC